MMSFRLQITSLADEYERIADAYRQAQEESLSLQKENNRLTQQLLCYNADRQDTDQNSSTHPIVDIDGLDIELPAEHVPFPDIYETANRRPGALKAHPSQAAEPLPVVSAPPDDPFPLDVATERQTLAPVWAGAGCQNGQENGTTPHSVDCPEPLDKVPEKANNCGRAASKASGTSDYSEDDATGCEASSKDSVKTPVFNFAYSGREEGEKVVIKPAGVFSKWFDPGLEAEEEADLAPVENFRTTFSQLAGQANSGKRVESNQKDACVLQPFGRLRLSWDSMAFLCLLIDLWLTPLDLIFMNSCPMPQALQNVGHCITIFFTVDILLNFHTGYVSGDQIIMKRSLVVINYMKFWFWVDLVATIPFHLIAENDTGDVLNTARASKASKALKGLRYLKMVRAARLVKTLATAGKVSQHFKLLGPLRVVFKGLQVLVFLAVFAHVHGCIWAAMQPQWVDVTEVSEAVRCYFRSFWWAYTAVTIGELGSPEGESTPLIWLLEMVIASERLSFIVFASLRIMFHSLHFLEEAQQDARVNAIMTYLRQRKVSIETQIQVSFFLTSTKKAGKLQSHYEALLAHDLPAELKASICTELWMDRLSSLGLIAHISTWHPMFLVSLTNLVREEAFPARFMLCKAGDRAMQAYYIVQGELLAIRVAARVTMPKFTRGMWVGENALASAALRCFATIQTRMLTCCMVLCGESFQQLLSELGLMREFQEFCSDQLWKGLCGRCGLLGDHFSDCCPGPLPMLSSFMTGRYSTMSDLALKDKDEIGSQMAMSTGSASTNSYLTANSGAGSLRSSGTQDLPTARSTSRLLTSLISHKEEAVPDSPRLLGRDLVHFLTEYNLMRLYHILQQLQIHHLDGLERLDTGIIQGMLAKDQELTDEEENALSEASIQAFKAKCKKEVNQALFRKVSRLHHYIFLSHYKVEAGTEAALMRTDVEQVLAEEPDGPGQWFDEPVFLDSENLTNLKDLQLRVSHTHNLVLLLSKEVLQRPWVLVEIVTARKHGVYVLPVRVDKPGDVFVYPDDAFYGNLRNGKFLDQDATDILLRCNCTLEDTEKALRAVFQQIAVSYSPHKTVSIRRAEIGALLKQCRLKDMSSREARAGRGNTSGGQRIGRGASSHRAPQVSQFAFPKA